MPQFKFTAKDEKSRTITGREFAMSERELIMRLARKNLTIVSIKRIDKTGIPGMLSRKHEAVRTFDMMVFCKQLATLIKGGVPLIRAIDIISSETKSHVLQAALADIAHYIRQGESFSSSMKRLSGTFPPLVISIVEAGEKVGALDVMLERLAKYLGARDRINRKIITAIAYPSVICLFFIGAICVMTLFLIPKFKGMYSSFSAKLPPLTTAVFGVSDFFVHNLFIIAGVTVAVIVYIYTVAFRTKKGRYIFDAVALKIPLFGDVVLKASISKFTRTLATLLEQGIAVPESLDMVSRSAGNAVIERACVKASKLILDGESIPEAFRKTGIFPPLVLQMGLIGTESGNLPELLDKTADFYEEQVDMFLAIMSSLIEPILIVSIGSVLAVFIVAMYLPIFSMSQALSKGM